MFQRVTQLPGSRSRRCNYSLVWHIDKSCSAKMVCTSSIAGSKGCRQVRSLVVSLDKTFQLADLHKKEQFHDLHPESNVTGEELHDFLGAIKDNKLASSPFYSNQTHPPTSPINSQLSKSAVFDMTTASTSSLGTGESLKASTYNLEVIKNPDDDAAGEDDYYRWDHFAVPGMATASTSGKSKGDSLQSQVLEDLEDGAE